MIFHVVLFQSPPFIFDDEHLLYTWSMQFTKKYLVEDQGCIVIHIKSGIMNSEVIRVMHYRCLVMLNSAICHVVLGTNLIFFKTNMSQRN